jgi:hypothetical protein
MQTRFDEPARRQVLFRLQPVEQLFDRRSRVVVTVLRVEPGAAQQLAPQLDAAVFALPQPLQRTGLQ